MSIRRIAVLVSSAVLAMVSSGCGNEDTVLPEGGSGTAAGESVPWNFITVTGSVVNLRAGPGTEYAVLDQVESGDSLQLTGGLDDWYRVYVPELSLFAWIYAPLTSGAELPR